jgi:hypothetical protein
VELPVQQISPYEQYLAQARVAEARRRHAWEKAAERRHASLSWPHDPWRGGFGPPARDMGNTYERSLTRDGGSAALNPSRGRSESGVRGWLSQNGLIRR